MNPNTEIYNAFNRQARCYEQAAKVQYEIGLRLFERLNYLKIQPRYILDLGCGPGIFLPRLKALYPRSEVVGVDLASMMLQVAKTKQSWRRKSHLVNADMLRLPFEREQFDLIFSNQVVHWSEPLGPLFMELHRVLSPSGCFMFSTLGPDTFQELHAAFAKVDGHAHINEFIDMHDIGDELLHALFQDPVMDMERLTAHYATLPSLLGALKSQGVRNINSKRNPGLTGRQSWSKFEQEMQRTQTAEGKWPLSYEVLYGHAWKGDRRLTAQGVETTISLAHLKKLKTDSKS